MLVQPYLFFEGRAEEALGFYREALGADLHGTSVFAEAEDGGVFHTCSTCARGAELLSGAFNRLGLAPKGRNEQGIVSWVRPHDGHGDAPADAGCCRRWPSATR